MMLTFTNSSGGCTDVVVTMPGFDPAVDNATIHPQYLDDIKMFAQSAGAA